MFLLICLIKRIYGVYIYVYQLHKLNTYKKLFKVDCYIINVREYRRDNKKWTIHAEKTHTRRRQIIQKHNKIGVGP